MPPGPPVGPERAGNLRELRTECVRFGRLLRRQGLPVGPEQVRRWLRAMDLTGLAHPADLYWTGRISLVCQQAHLAVYDESFRQFWLQLDHVALEPAAGREAVPASRAQINPRRTLLQEAADERERQPAGAEGSRSSLGSGSRWQVGAAYLPPGSMPERSDAAPEVTAPPGTGWYSALELLRDKDFAAYSETDLSDLGRLLEEDRLWLSPLLRSRRSRPASSGDRLDLKRTVAAAMRTGGEPLLVKLRAPRRRWRKWLFLCDISASMAPYLSGLLCFLQAVTARRRATEVFLFGTRLTRVTPHLRRLRSGRELAPVRDWHGGTRLGESLEQFLRQYGRRGMAHGAVLFILSDGLDLGRPGLTGEAMQRLDRMAARIVWINPLKRAAEYSPTAQAMAEALPFIDDFTSGHSLRSLQGLIRRQAEADR